MAKGESQLVYLTNLFGCILSLRIKSFNLHKTTIFYHDIFQDIKKCISLMRRFCTSNNLNSVQIILNT